MVKYFEDDSFEYAGSLEDEIHLENGGFLVIGDNVAESRDSRYHEVGIVDCVDVIGVVISPPNRNDK